MVSFWKIFYTSREQVIADIESVLEAILKLCTANLDLLSQEERSSFMDEYSSLADARIRLNKGTNTSTLTGALDECEKLKLRIERACRKHQEDKIRRGLDPAAIAAAGSPKSSIALVDPDPSNRTPPSERPISVQSNSAMASGNGSRPSDPSAGTGSFVTAMASGNGSRPSDPSAGSFVSANTSVARQTTSSSSAVSTEGSQYVPPVTDKDCMIFGLGSSVGSPTFNIDSQEATGATHTSSGNSPSVGPPAQRLPFLGAYQPQATYTVKREQVMYFEPGTEAGSPTFNIRSPRASGTIEQVVAHRSEASTALFS